MTAQATFFDDLARLATGAMGMAAGVQDEAKAFMRAQADRLAAELDLVPREEFEAMKALAQSAQAKADALEERIAALEAKLR